MTELSFKEIIESEHLILIGDDIDAKPWAAEEGRKKKEYTQLGHITLNVGQGNMKYNIWKGDWYPNANPNIFWSLYTPASDDTKRLEDTINDAYNNGTTGRSSAPVLKGQNWISQTKVNKPIYFVSKEKRDSLKTTSNESFKLEDGGTIHQIYGGISGYFSNNGDTCYYQKVDKCQIEKKIGQNTFHIDLEFTDDKAGNLTILDKAFEKRWDDLIGRKEFVDEKVKEKKKQHEATNSVTQKFAYYINNKGEYEEELTKLMVKNPKDKDGNPIETLDGKPIETLDEYIDALDAELKADGGAGVRLINETEQETIGKKYFNISKVKADPFDEKAATNNATEEFNNFWNNTYRNVGWEVTDISNGNFKFVLTKINNEEIAKLTIDNKIFKGGRRIKRSKKRSIRRRSKRSKKRSIRRRSKRSKKRSTRRRSKCSGKRKSRCYRKKNTSGRRLKR